MARKRMGLKPPKQRLMFNIRSLFDIPTMHVTRGRRGEPIMLAGLTDFVAFTGAGNVGKSLLLYYAIFASCNVVASTHEPYLTINDTEANINLSRLNSLASKFEYLPDDIFDEDNGFAEASDRSTMIGDEWWRSVKTFAKDLLKSKSDMVEYTGILDSRKKPIVDFLPSFAIVDSFSKFESKGALDVLDKAKTDNESSTYYIKAGSFKTKMLSELTMLGPKINLYFGTVAHIGKKSTMDENKYSKPVKSLTYLKEGEQIKKVTEEFNYLSKTLFKVLGVQLLRDDNNGPLYPMDNKVDTRNDLNLIKLEFLRNKNGASGTILEILVSQSEGVLPYLTEFHFIKVNGYYGLEGNNRNFASVFMPDVKLSRTKIRGLLENNKRLQIAMRITADLLQFKIFKPEYITLGLYMEPKQLYERMIELGYDWDELLDTRGWWAIDQYAKDIPPYMSTLYLLEVANGKNKFYWKKTNKQK